MTRESWQTDAVAIASLYCAPLPDHKECAWTNNQEITVSLRIGGHNRLDVRKRKNIRRHHSADVH